MRIAHVTATFPPYWAGTGNVAYHNARLLHERGHEVVVLTAEGARGSGLTFPFEVRRLPAAFRVGNAPLTPRLLAELRGFDLIHLHYPYIFGAELATLAARRYRTPLVLTYHNDLLATGVRGLLFRIYNCVSQPWVLSKASRLLGTSGDYAAHSLLGRTAPTDAEIGALPNGVDLTAFTPRPKASPYALLVGGLDRAHHFKGVDVFIEALGLLKHARAVIVGDGDLRPTLERQAEQVAPGRVEFAGRVPPERLAELYAEATVTVLPSTTQGEAFGLVLVESFASGTAVIASNLPGVRTVVSHGQDGLLVEPGDTLGLARALHHLLNDPEQAYQMGRRGLNKTRRLYDWNVIGDQLDSISREFVACR